MRDGRQRHYSVLFGLLLCVLMSGIAVAATSPAQVVQQFIDAHLQGRFAEARGFTLEQANLQASVFSSWLFGARGGSPDATTADIFLSRKFAQTFRYQITGTTPNGDRQVYVTAMRSSPNLVHLYTWALAPKQGAPPYDLIEAVDTYLTKVNFPVEESRMQFTLILEAEEWYISAIYDDKFAQLQHQWLLQPPAGRPMAAATPANAPPPAMGAGGAMGAPTTTTSTQDPGRQMADAQYNATLQSFNRTYQSPASAPPPPAKPEAEKPSFLGKVANLFGLGGSGKSSTMVKLANSNLKETVSNIRDALARYAVGNGGMVPDSAQIYDWQSLRLLVNQYGKKSLPATEAEAGFNFLNYRADPSVGDYVLLIELHDPKDGVKSVEVTPYGVDRAG